MSNPIAFLNGDPDEVGELLMQVARRERAPHGARERALSRVAAVSLGAAAVAGTSKAALAAPQLASSGGILAAKWLAIGLSGAFLSLTAIDQVQRVLAPVTEQRAKPAAVSAPAAPGVAQPTEVPSGLPVVVSPPASSAAERAAPKVAVAPQSPTTEAPLVSDVAVSSPSAAAFDAPSSAQLAREVAALRSARAQLAQGKPGHALETLAQYHREFPVGVLGTEEAALRVEIAFAMGDGNAPELARRFVASHAASPLAARVRALLDAKSTNGVKP